MKFKSISGGAAGNRTGIVIMSIVSYGLLGALIH